MKTKIPSLERYGIVSGFFTGLVLIAYFMLMVVLGFGHVLELRFFNFVIMAVGICLAIRRYRHDLAPGEFYLRGWGQGLFTAAVATLFFGIFMAFYLSVFDRGLLAYIQQNAAAGQPINGFSIFLAIFMEGMAGGFIITLAAMQYFKREGGRKGGSGIHPIDRIAPKNKSLNA